MIEPKHYYPAAFPSNDEQFARTLIRIDLYQTASKVTLILSQKFSWSPTSSTALKALEK